MPLCQYTTFPIQTFRIPLCLTGFDKRVGFQIDNNSLYSETRRRSLFWKKISIHESEIQIYEIQVQS